MLEKINRASFSEWLEKGEIIEYYEQKELGFISQPITILMIIVGIFFLMFGIPNSDMHTLGFPLLIFGIPLFLYSIYADYYEEGFAITSRKIIILGKKGKPNLIPYNKIFSIRIVERNKAQGLYFNAKPHSSSILMIVPETTIYPSSGRIYKLKKKVDRIWKKQSPYVLFNQKMKTFSKKLSQLSITPLDFNQKNEFRLKGSINGVNFTLSLNNAANFNSLKIHIYCNNEEDNFLRLRPETSKDNISKLLLGIQDYEINQKWFDDEFIIQSNYEPFVTSILSEELLPIIHHAMIDLKGEIIMGNKADMEKQTRIDIHEGQTLDAHLLGEKEIDRQRIKDHGSTLTYTSSNLKYTDDFEKIADDIILNIEMMVALAEKINGYNDMN